MAQDQQDKTEQQIMATESDLTTTPGQQESTETPVRKKRGKKKVTRINEAELMPRPSYWPLALAASLAVLLFGFLGLPTNPIVLGLGAVLVLISIIGWGLEHR